MMMMLVESSCFRPFSSPASVTTRRLTPPYVPPESYFAPSSGNSLILHHHHHRLSPVDGFRSRPRKMTSLLCLSALTPQLKTTIDKVVASQKVVLFMKGTKEFPQCGFSHTVVQILMSLNVPFETINILENELLRQALKDYSSWPTFPQLYIDGEFFGGCDITLEAYKSGQLQELLEKALCS